MGFMPTRRKCERGVENGWVKRERRGGGVGKEREGGRGDRERACM